MWPQLEMVAMVVVAERAAKMNRDQHSHMMPELPESASANGSHRTVALVLALLIAAAVGRMVLI